MSQLPFITNFVTFHVTISLSRNKFQDGTLPQSAHKTCPKNSCLTLASVHRDDSGKINFILYLSYNANVNVDANLRRVHLLC